jgi:hypothetical protein
MRFHPLLAFTAILLGSALGTVHGCSSGPASADTGGGGAGGTGGACPPVTCVAPTPTPTLITTYADLLATLKSGARVRGVFDYGKCKLSGQPGPNALGAMNFDTFEWFGAKVLGNPKAYLAASENHLIHLTTGFVNDYVRVRVSEDDKVEIEVKYADPQTYALSVDELIQCGLSDGKTELGATFYKMP